MEKSKQCRAIVAAQLGLKDSGESSRCVTSAVAGGVMPFSYVP